MGVTVLMDASDLSRARYDAGLASYIEILTADQDLFACRSQTKAAAARAAGRFAREIAPLEIAQRKGAPRLAPMSRSEESVVDAGGDDVDARRVGVIQPDQLLGLFRARGQ